jgi:hypothetical protein
MNSRITIRPVYKLKNRYFSLVLYRIVITPGTNSARPTSPTLRFPGSLSQGSRENSSDEQAYIRRR